MRLLLLVAAIVFVAYYMQVCWEEGELREGGRRVGELGCAPLCKRHLCRSI
jgi:hypothetical protein